MKKIITLAIAFLLFIPFASIHGSNITQTKIVDGSVLYVGGDGPNNYTSIQSAIRNASDGDTIIVFGGVYREYISINKKLSIIGRENKDGEFPHLMCPPTQFPQTMVYITGDECIFSNFVVDGDGRAFEGIWIKGDKVTISNNVIENNEDGIDIEYSKDNIIENNVISNNSFCSLEVSSPYNTIKNNYFYNNFRGVFLHSSNNVVCNNSFLMDGIFTYGKQIIENNTVNGKSLRYYYNASDFSIPKNTGEVILVRCSDVSIQDIVFSNASSDIVIQTFPQLSDKKLWKCLLYGVNYLYARNKFDKMDSKR